MFSLFVTGTRRINECWSAQAAVGYTAKRAEHRHRRPPVAARAVATKRSGPEVRRRNDPWPDRWILWLGVGLHHVREHGHRTGNLDRGAYSGIVGAESEPLPSILLLEDRLGIRFHEAAESPRWSIEWTARVVAAQRRVANSLLEVPSSGFTVCDVTLRILTNSGTRSVERLRSTRPTVHVRVNAISSMPSAAPRLREYCLSCGLFQCSWTPRLAKSRGWVRRGWDRRTCRREGRGPRRLRADSRPRRLGGDSLPTRPARKSSPTESMATGSCEANRLHGQSPSKGEVFILRDRVLGMQPGEQPVDQCSTVLPPRCRGPSGRPAPGRRPFAWKNSRDACRSSLFAPASGPASHSGSWRRASRPSPCAL
jgi:hypothetical protein